jgi:MoxR-like ATPase
MPSLRGVMLEGPSGCGKSFLAKSLAKISGAEMMTLQCHSGMELKNLIEMPSTLAMVNAMAGNTEGLDPSAVMNLGIISRAFLKSQEKPVILLIDELDKVEVAIDTFFLGPIQDGCVHPETREAIYANRDNIFVMFTKNMERKLNDALLRRLHPIEMDYMSSELEKKVLSPYCAPRLVENLVRIGTIMRNTDGSYPFDRPPAPEELLKTAKYIVHLLKWNITDFGFVGKNIWYMLAKSEHDRAVFESLLRYHPDFFDPLVPDGRKASKYQIFSRLGRIVLEGIVVDPDDERRGKAYRPEEIGLTKVGTPEALARKLGEVGYQCLPFVATQVALLLNTPTGRTRGLLLEGPSGCGKSFLAKCLAKITGAHFMCMSCYKDMETKFLIEYPSEMATAKAKAGEKIQEEELMSLGVLSRAFLKSQSQPTILLVDEIDKVDAHVDTFFLGPLQDGRIWLESRPPMDANLDNLLIVFTKNENRVLDQALLRRLHPIRMTYLDSTLERKILSKHCIPQLVANLVAIADRMRNSNGSYEFERPPAPEELLTAGHYISQMLEWETNDFTHIGKNVWAILSKSEHDRAVLDHMLRFHPDFEDPLFPDGKNTPMDEIFARLGRWALKGIVEDPDAERREAAWSNMVWD